MTLTDRTCRRCGAGLTPASTGRPPIFCGEACRRLTEREIARLDRLLAKLEERILNQRASPTISWAATVEALEVEHARIEARLRELLDDPPAAPPT